MNVEPEPQEMRRAPREDPGGPRKEKVVATLAEPGSAFRKYGDFFVGRPGWAAFLRYEAAMLLAQGTRGALGFVLRKHLYPGLFDEVGRGVNFGRDISLRCPGRMRLGDQVAIDDGCALDARGADGPGDFVIGPRTLIARDTILVVKQGYLRIGADSSIGTQCCFSAVSGIEIGHHAIIAGQCYFGGGRYRTALGAGPMVEQGLQTRGPVVLGDDVWVGSGARILDGVRIEQGAIVGAGAVVTADVAENTIVGGCPAKRIGTRR